AYLYFAIFLVSPSPSISFLFPARYKLLAFRPPAMTWIYLHSASSTPRGSSLASACSRGRARTSLSSYPAVASPAPPRHPSSSAPRSSSTSASVSPAPRLPRHLTCASA
ncbi:hypothetical protein C8R44DRAFT_817670, partial [Mycena epipterygia]